MTNGERLRAYLDERGIRHSFLAQRLGCNHATMSRMLSGATIPRWKRRIAIEEFTEGAVPANRWENGGSDQ